MKTGIFSQEELVETFDDTWDPPSGWQNISELADEERKSLFRDVLRSLHDYRAAVILIDTSDPAGPRPLGSGVLVRGYHGYGVLTAGHVCVEIKRRGLANSQCLWCLPVMADRRVGEPFRRLLVSKVELAYSSGVAVPDYGCIVMPSVKGRDAAAWGTFVNITAKGVSRRTAPSRLEHGVWAAAGYVEERSGDKAFFSQYLIGGPEAVYERGGMRYFFVIDKNDEPGLPRSIGGMSGGGLWRLRASRQRDDGVHEIGIPTLAGIAFRQKYRAGIERLAFYAHDLESIADHVVTWLDGHHHS